MTRPGSRCWEAGASPAVHGRKPACARRSWSGTLSSGGQCRAHTLSPSRLTMPQTLAESLDVLGAVLEGGPHWRHCPACSHRATLCLQDLTPLLAARLRGPDASPPTQPPPCPPRYLQRLDMVAPGSSWRGSPSRPLRQPLLFPQSERAAGPPRGVDKPMLSRRAAVAKHATHFLCENEEARAPRRGRFLFSASRSRLLSEDARRLPAARGCKALGTRAALLRGQASLRLAGAFCL